MVLPLPDLTGVIAAIDRSTNMIEKLVNEMVRSNEDTAADLEAQVRDIREVMEQQYRDTITNLKERLPKDGSPIPPGWSKRPPGFASPE
jgi:hypothetical protein